MRRSFLLVLGVVLLCTATAAMVADAAPPAKPAIAAPAAMSPAPTAAPLLPSIKVPFPPSPLFTCNIPPTTTCSSCFDLGVTSSYQCTTWCLNGELHRECNQCGEGCND